MTPTMLHRARRLREKGASLREIAAALGVEHTTVRDHLNANAR